jgi:hypothetical protein
MKGANLQTHFLRSLKKILIKYYGINKKVYLCTVF